MFVLVCVCVLSNKQFSVFEFVINNNKKLSMLLGIISALNYYILCYFFILGKVDEKATQLHAIASLKVLLDATKPQNGAATTSAANHIKQETALALPPSSATSDVPNGIAGAIADVNLDSVSHTITKTTNETCERMRMWIKREEKFSFVLFHSGWCVL